MLEGKINLKIFKILFILVALVFIAVHGLSLVASGGFFFFNF